MSVSFLIVLAACSGPEPVDTAEPPTPPPPTVPEPWQATVVQVDTVGVHIEHVSSRASDSAVPLAPADTISTEGDETHRLDPFGDGALVAYDLAPVHAASAWEGVLLLATTEGLRAWDGGLVPLDLASLVTGVTGMIDLPSGLWMETDTGLVVVRDGEVMEVVVDGQPAHGFARGASGLSPAIWTAAGPHVVAVRFSASGLVLLESRELFDDVTAVAASSTGRVLAIAGGWLVQRTPNGEWTRLDVGSPVRELRGSRGNAAIWVRTDDAWLYTPDPETFLETDVPLDAPVSEDDHGRLVAGTDQGVTRYSVGLPLLLLDAPVSNVLTPTTMRVVPSAPDLAPALAVEADDGLQVVALTVEDYAFTLDPDVLSPGIWTVRATATYTNETSTAEAIVQMGAVVTPTWNDTVQPMYTAYCAQCHIAGGATLLDLSTQQAWIDHFTQGTEAGTPGILERLQVGDMPPPGNPAPTATNLVELQLWRDGGFP